MNCHYPEYTVYIQTHLYNKIYARLCIISSRAKRECALAYPQTGAPIRYPLEPDPLERPRDRHVGCTEEKKRTKAHVNNTPLLQGQETRPNVPSSPTLNGNVLYDRDPASPPCLGGRPGCNSPLAKLGPTFHTCTTPSSSETVTSRRPSGEKAHAVGRWVCPSRT